MSVKQYSESGNKNAKFVKKTAESSNLFCDYCQPNRDTREKCFCLHGYLDWHKLQGKPKPKPPNSLLSDNITYESVPAFTALKTSPTISGSSEFSEAQCKQIMQFIQAGFKDLIIIPSFSTPQNVSKTVHSAGTLPMYAFHSCHTLSLESKTWILDDSGATDHITLCQGYIEIFI